MNVEQLPPKGSLFFAPMEGITDVAYRQTILKLYPEWDRVSTDFLRIPTEGSFTNKFILHHYGTKVFNDESQKEKTTIQVLTTPRAQTERTVKQISDLGFNHLDLNLGCPSRRVNSHQGGAYLLSDLMELKKIIRVMRKSFPKLFTVKIRLGYRDDQNYLDSLKLFENEGVEAITVHARTRDQLYKGVADWSYIKKAVDHVNIPIIGNGDIWTLEDVQSIFEKTSCHSLMLARGAMKTPWFAQTYREEKKIPSKERRLEIRKKNLPVYFNQLEKEYTFKKDEEVLLLRRFKAFSRYLFDDFPEGEEIKRKFLRAKSLVEFKNYLSEFCH